MYLGPSSCISFQDTIGEENPWNVLEELSSESQLIQPNYKEFVKPALLRRMSTALKMGVAGGKSCLQQAQTANCDAITVGTGLGCVRDTLRFMKVMYEENETGLSPTSFIQSTHNSIAGQIALLLGNHGYNMTHVQGGLSLGYALSDAELLLAEKDAASVLVGVVDEKTDELVELLDKLSATASYPLPKVGEGAAFFLATAEKSAGSVAKMVELSMSKILDQKADLVLSNTDQGFNYTQFSGEHFAAPGFGLFLALKAFEVNEVHNHWINFSNPQRILVRHSFLGQELSILLERA
jgi:hypothetical protein